MTYVISFMKTVKTNIRFTDFYWIMSFYNDAALLKLQFCITKCSLYMYYLNNNLFNIPVFKLFIFLSV